MDLIVATELFQSQQYHKIIDWYSETEFRISSDPLLGQLIAACYFKTGDFQKSLPILEAIESSFENDPSFWSLYGATCRRLADLPRAEKYLRKAIELDSNSLVFKNNYSNLLIDSGKFDEAISTLTEILAEQPDYQDALDNLNRANFIRQRLADISSTSIDSRESILAESTILTSSLQLSDPLMLAFSDDEVANHGRIKKYLSKTKSTGLISELPSMDEQKLGKEAILLARKAFDESNYEVSLRYCSKALSHLGSNPSIYDVAADNYISLRNFRAAEICVLTSLALSTPTSKQYINLVSLASLRGDLKLAYTYLDSLASIDPSNPNLDRLKVQLLDSKSKASDQYSFKSQF